MAEKLTPLLSQYQRIKKRYPETILLFRVGDFYEMFYQDAEIGARALNLTLTSRPHGPDHRVPLAGIPAKSLDTYVARLVEQGYKVAVCEQLEPPNQGKPVVARDVVEVITPGTLVRDAFLNEHRNNYLMAISPGGVLGIAFTDLSTGEFYIAEINVDALAEEVTRISPSELLLPQNWDKELPPYLPVKKITSLDDYYFTPEFAFEKLTSHFGVANLAGFGVDHLTEGICAAGAILEYLEQTQCTTLPHLQRLTPYYNTDFLLIDRISRRNLELLEKIHPQNNQDRETGTLFWLLNRTRTPAGARLLRRWLLAPLLAVEKINKRLEAVAEFLKPATPLEQLRQILGKIGDLERVASRIALDRATPRDLLALRSWLSIVPEIKLLLKNTSATILKQSETTIPNFTPLVNELDALADSPPATITEGGIFRPGYHAELDNLRQLTQSAKEFLAQLQESERTRTGIPNLRIGYNSVFGYYIEVTKSYLKLVPKDYIRKQTVASGERYITPQLKDWETKITTAEDRIKTLEYELFIDLRNRIKPECNKIIELSTTIASIDVLAAFAHLAREKNYCRPTIDTSTTIEIKSGRHPVVEALTSEPFIPNDTYLDTTDNQILIITGPNMAGKSTYLRQIASIVIMAQIGSYVPARAVRIGVVDKIFTRIGASDDLARGVSTFLAEMNETANILNNATSRSLVILDEVGRGTSTEDGVAIAWATVEYLHGNDQFRPRTLFATHYHELTRIAQHLPRTKNYSFLVKEKGDEVLFLRKLHPGPADKSYGIAVAKLAGLPEPVIRRARELLIHLTRNEQINFAPLNSRIETRQILEPSLNHPVLTRLRELNINELSPLEALNLLAELVQIVRSENIQKSL
ncbi:MAG: DNA mismatch repair protein MutS [bacterium]